MNAHPAAESPYAWWRLVVSLALMTLGGVGMYSVTVVLPRIQADFGVDRGDASLPYTLTMVGFGVGGIDACWHRELGDIVLHPCSGRRPVLSVAAMKEPAHLALHP